MPENKNNKNVRDDEIDLLDLFQRMGRTLTRCGKALGRGFLVSVVFLLKRWLPLGLSIVLGLGISWVAKKEAAKIYSSEMTVRSNVISNSDMITYINRLHVFSTERDTTSLAQALSLPLEKVRLIKDIQAFWAIDLGNDGVPDKIDYKDNYVKTDTINVRMTDRFIIRIRLVNSREFSQFTGNIIKYASQNPLFQQKNQIRLAQNNEIRTRVIYDINQLDSLQKVKYFEETRNRVPSSGGQMIFLQQQTTQLIYPDIYELYSRKQAIDNELEIYKEIVTLLNDFTQPALPINRNNYYVTKLVPVFFIITLILLILLANKKKLVEVFKKY